MKLDAALKKMGVTGQHSKEGYESFSRLARLLNCDWLELLPGRDIVVTVSRDSPNESKTCAFDELKFCS